MLQHYNISIGKAQLYPHCCQNPQTVCPWPREFHAFEIVHVSFIRQYNSSEVPVDIQQKSRTIFVLSNVWVGEESLAPDKFSAITPQRVVTPRWAWIVNLWDFLLKLSSFRSMWTHWSPLKWTQLDPRWTLGVQMWSKYDHDSVFFSHACYEFLY